jgi:uncharacterized pyridoxal phosphate-containing UPF0001 family protein
MGVTPEDTIPLVQHILENCKQLQLIGIMTIGSLEESTSEVNNDFKVGFDQTTSDDCRLRIK